MGTKLFSDLITFTRASSATRVNSSGRVEAVASDKPRFDYDPVTLQPKGLLIEEQRTNLLTYSRDLTTNWTGFGASIESSTELAPDGSAANKFVESSGLAEHGVFQITTTSGSNAYSIYLKNNGRRYAVLRRDSGTGSLVVFDLQAGAVTQEFNAKGSIINAGNGWYLCSMTSSVSTGNTVLKGSDVAAGVVVNSIYTGNGVSGFFVYGAQLEAGAFPTSYIPTTAAAATRAADAAMITGANFSSWYRQNEGTFMCSWRIQDTTSQTDSQHQLIWVNTSGTNPTIALRLGYNAGRRMRGYAQDGSAVFQYAVDAPVTAATIGSTAIAYSSSNDFALCDSGGTVSKNTSGNISSFSVNQMQIGAGSGVLNGWVSRVAYYPRRLTDAELQELTT